MRRRSWCVCVVAVCVCGPGEGVCVLADGACACCGCACVDVLLGGMRVRGACVRGVTSQVGVMSRVCVVRRRCCPAGCVRVCRRSSCM